MTSASRRYEILLPRKFNDGTPVPDELFTQTLVELEDRYSAVSVETQIIHGRWKHEGEVYHDEMV